MKKKDTRRKGSEIDRRCFKFRFPECNSVHFAGSHALDIALGVVRALVLLLLLLFCGTQIVNLVLAKSLSLTNELRVQRPSSADFSVPHEGAVTLETLETTWLLPSY